MLAPRKTLWSTPSEVVRAAIEALEITAEDVVYDVGAGDGRFIVACAKETGAQCVGIEIDETRSNEAKAAIEANGLSDICSVQACNALHVDYTSATVMFMYLIPRGLKIMLPILESLSQPLRVATYMSPLPGITPTSVVRCSTFTHPEAQWPLYIYHLRSAPSTHYDEALSAPDMESQLDAVPS